MDLPHTESNYVRFGVEPNSH